MLLLRDAGGVGLAWPHKCPAAAQYRAAAFLAADLPADLQPARKLRVKCFHPPCYLLAHVIAWSRDKGRVGQNPPRVCHQAQHFAHVHMYFQRAVDDDVPSLPQWRKSVLAGRPDEGRRMPHI